MTKGDSDVDALYQLSLSEFTSARNNLAAKLKNDGRTDEAARVKALVKPPVSAWAVNQLYWRHRKQFDHFMATGDRLRAAHASQLRGKGGEIHAPLEARSAALSELTQRAAALLRESGHTPSPDLMRRIMTTLEALASYGSRASASAAGRLSDDMDAPGFEALAGLAASKDGGAQEQGRRVLPFTSRHERVTPRGLSPEERKAHEAAERKAQLAAATTAVRDGEKALAEARKVAERSEAALKKAAALARDSKKEQDALSARLEKATAAAEEARREAHRIAGEAEEAAQAVADAERSLNEAKRNYKALS
jgi:hypothetical protein